MLCLAHDFVKLQYVSAKVLKKVLVLPFSMHGLTKLEDRPYRGFWSTYTLIMINRLICVITRATIQ